MRNIRLLSFSILSQCARRNDKSSGPLEVGQWKLTQTFQGAAPAATRCLQKKRLRFKFLVRGPKKVSSFLFIHLAHCKNTDFHSFKMLLPQIPLVNWF